MTFPAGMRESALLGTSKGCCASSDTANHPLGGPTGHSLERAGRPQPSARSGPGRNASRSRARGRSAPSPAGCASVSTSCGHRVRRDPCVQADRLQGVPSRDTCGHPKVPAIAVFKPDPAKGTGLPFCVQAERHSRGRFSPAHPPARGAGPPAEAQGACVAAVRHGSPGRSLAAAQSDVYLDPLRPVRPVFKPILAKGGRASTPFRPPSSGRDPCVQAVSRLARPIPFWGRKREMMRFC